MSESESDNSVEQVQERRLFVGGLFPEVNDEELKSRFGRFGTVKNTEIKIRKDSNGNPLKTFAYIDLEGNDMNFKKCVSTYNKTKWKGSELKIQIAKEDFMKRLKKEREEALKDVELKEVPDAPVSGIQSKLMAISDIATAANFNMKGAVPGTAIPGEEKWVVGKYGRVLPIVHMKRTGASKILKIDPSKLTHNLRKIKDDKYVDDKNPNQLTWQLEEYDSEISKKRKGKFPEWEPRVKRKRNVNDDLNKRVLEVVERDKNYRHSDFEVVSVTGKAGSIPVPDRPLDSFNDVGNNDYDREGEEIQMMESSSNNIVDGFMDLSRFNSDSEEEMSTDAFIKTGLGRLNQGQNKSSINVQEQSIQVNHNTSLKIQQLSRKLLSSQGLVDEYSDGLTDESMTEKDKIVGSSYERVGYESDNESDNHDDDNDDDDSDFESLVQREMKNCVTDKHNMLEKSVLKPKQKHSLASDTKTDIKSTNGGNDYIEVKKNAGKIAASTLQRDTNNIDKSKEKRPIKMKKQSLEINFDRSVNRTGFKNLVNPKFLCNEFASGLDIEEDSKGNASSGEDYDDSDFETFAKKELAKMEAGKKQSDVKNSNAEHFYSYQGDAGFPLKDIIDEKKKGYHSNSDSDDSEKESEMESVSKETGVTVKNAEQDCTYKSESKIIQNRMEEEDDNDEEDDGDEEEDSDDEEDDGYEEDSDDEENDEEEDDAGDDDDVSDFESFVKREMVKSKSSVPESTSLNYQGNSQENVSEKQNNVEKLSLKPKIVEGKKTLLAFRGTQFLPSDTKTNMKGVNGGNDSVNVKDVEDNVDDDDVVDDINDDEEEESNDDGSDDDENESNNDDVGNDDDEESDFETLISKAVKEAHGLKHLDVISGVSKTCDKGNKPFNKNVLYKSKHEGSCSIESESTEESSEADEDSDNEMNDNSDNVSEHSNNVSEMLKINHNKNLDANSLFVNAINDNESFDDSEDDSDVNSYKSNDDVLTHNDNKKVSSKGKKNQTLDYSGIMSESSDSDNDTLVETESESSDDSFNEGNMSVLNKDEAIVGSINDNEMVKLCNIVKANIESNGKSEESDSGSGSEESDSDTEHDEDVKMTKGDIKGSNKTKQNLNAFKTDKKETTNANDDINSEYNVCQKVKISQKSATSPMKRIIGHQDVSSFQENNKISPDGPSPVKKPLIEQSKSHVRQPRVETKADVDKKRLAAVKERQKEALAQKSLIKNALSNLDASKSVNKKIKFESDSEDEQVAMETNDPIPAVTSQSQDKNKPMESKTVAKSKNLFDSDDDSDDDDNSDDDANRFNIRKEFEGAEGRKLAKLQSRFGNDERFRLDARFLESGSEDNEEDQKIDEEDETTRSLKILQSVVGIKAVSGISKQDKAKKLFKDVGALKYDPTCEEHKQFEVQKEPEEQQKPMEKKKKKKGKKKKGDIAVETEPAVILPEVAKDKFFEISDSLRNTFVQKANTPSTEPSNGGGFSLLAAFGAPQCDDDASNPGDMTTANQDSFIPIPDNVRTDQLALANRFNVRDDVDHEKSNGDEVRDKDNGDQEILEKMDTTEQPAKQGLVSLKPKSFFFLPNDERLKESVTRKNESSGQDDWVAKRRHLIESYKTKHKNLRRKKGPMKKRCGKR